jgi:hypothetical protein
MDNMDLNENFLEVYHHTIKKNKILYDKYRGDKYIQDHMMLE